MPEPEPRPQSLPKEIAVNLLTAAFAWLLLTAPAFAAVIAMRFLFSSGQPLLAMAAAICCAAAFVCICWNFWNIIGAAANTLSSSHFKNQPPPAV